MTATVREKFSSQAAPDVLAALRQIAENQGRHQFQAVLGMICSFVSPTVEPKPLRA